MRADRGSRALVVLVALALGAGRGEEVPLRQRPDGAGRHHATSTATTDLRAGGAHARPQGPAHQSPGHVGGRRHRVRSRDCATAPVDSGRPRAARAVREPSAQLRGRARAAPAPRAARRAVHGAALDRSPTTAWRRDRAPPAIRCSSTSSPPRASPTCGCAAGCRAA